MAPSVARQRHQPAAERVHVGGLDDEHAGVETDTAREALADQLARERLCLAAGCDAQRARAVADQIADRARLALGDQAPVDEHDHARRHALDLVQHVRGDQNGAAFGAEPPDQLHHVAALDGIEAVQRLVEQQQLGRVHERLGQLDALAHALREAAHATLRRVFQPHGRERLGGRLGRVGDVAQTRHQLDQLACREERPEAVAVVHDADALVDRGLAPRIVTEHPHRAGARIGEAGAERQRGRLARAVVSEQPGHAGSQLERHLCEGHRVAVPLRDACEDQRQASALR